MKECLKRYVTIRHKDGHMSHFAQTPDLKPWSVEDLRDMVDPEAEIINIDEAPYVELTQEEATLILETAEIDGDQIRYDGKWLQLGRTSFSDDVRTGGRSIGEHWRERMRYGARVDNRSFFIIDQYSDG